MKPDLKGMTTAEIEQFVKGMGEHAYRGRQIAQWIYAHGAPDFERMSSLPKALRERCSREARIGNLETLTTIATPAGDARKFLFRLEDHETIET
ncbi:MAG: 23S rRNA (adenine(2503)-C(2))-methyltransferase RlmN, partial [Deltaproteobacteria bacterium]